jgi:hypothetical protein
MSFLSLPEMMGFYTFYIVGMTMKEQGMAGGWGHRVMSHPLCGKVAALNLLFLIVLAYRAIDCEAKEDHGAGFRCSTGVGTEPYPTDPYHGPIIIQGVNLAGAKPPLTLCLLGICFRVFGYMTSVPAALLLLTIFPNRNVVFAQGTAIEYNLTKKGSRSIVNYVFHFFVFLALCQTGWYQSDTWQRQLATVGIAIATTQLLLTEAADALLSPLTAPPMESWFKED